MAFASNSSRCLFKRSAASFLPRRLNAYSRVFINDDFVVVAVDDVEIVFEVRDDEDDGVTKA